MIQSYIRITKILDGPMSLGRSFIENITMNGEALPAWLSLDSEHGQIERISGEIDRSVRYTFEFQYWRPTTINIEMDKVELLANGTDTANIEILPVEISDDEIITTDSDISLALYKHDGIQWSKRDTLIVSDNAITLVFDTNTGGRWKLVPDPDTLNATWQRPAAIGNEVEFIVTEI